MDIKFLEKRCQSHDCLPKKRLSRANTCVTYKDRYTSTYKTEFGLAGCAYGLDCSNVSMSCTCCYIYDMILDIFPKTREHLYCSYFCFNRKKLSIVSRLSKLILLQKLKEC